MIQTHFKMTVVKNFRDYVNNNWQKTIALAQGSNRVLCLHFLTIKSIYNKSGSTNQNMRRFSTSACTYLFPTIRRFRRIFVGQRVSHLGDKLLIQIEK